jgi:hypothetical protein
MVRSKIRILQRLTRSLSNGFPQPVPELLTTATALNGLIQALHKHLIVPMGGHVGGNASPDVKTKEVEVPDQVQDLVAHELVGKTELRIDDLAVVHDDVGMEISAPDFSELLGHFDVLKGIERAGRGG